MLDGREMIEDKRDLNEYILRIVGEIYSLFGPTVPDEWLSSDLTVTQLRLLLVLHTHGPLRMSDIASQLKVTLPTTTTIVDHLIRKNMVQRETDPKDRRLVICKLTTEGQMLINKLWGSGRSIIEKLLEGLTREQMEKIAELADLLYQNAQKITKVDRPDTNVTRG
jgi:DNA-binding MarR family transcriptional regulator